MQWAAYKCKGQCNRPGGGSGSMGKKVIKKSNGRLKFLYRKGKYLNMYTRKRLVTALIQCHFDYACSIWYSFLTKATQNKLQTSQNKLIRYVLDLPSRAHVGLKEFKEINWLPVAYRVTQIKLNHMYKIISGKAPEYLTNSVHMTIYSELHSHNTRGSLMSVQVPRVNSAGQRSFLYTATTSWNNLSNPVKTSSSIIMFKRNVKAGLFSQLQLQEDNIYVYM